MITRPGGQIISGGQLAHIQPNFGQDDFGDTLVYPRDGVQQLHCAIPTQGRL
jgi:hypothetical protein